MINSFRRLYKRTKLRESPSEEYFTKLEQVTRDKARLEQELSQAIDVICDLQERLAEHDFMLAHPTSSSLSFAIPPFQVDSPVRSNIPRAISPAEITPPWIDDIWICSNSSLLLIEAEEQWRNDDPELAIELAWQVISRNPFICELDEMQCRLFIAAVQHYLGQYEQSIKSLEEVLQINTCYAVLNNPDSKIIAAITSFIKGRNLMKIERFPEAYLSFARALDTPGYRKKAREFQKEAVVGFTRIETVEFDNSPEASTRALLDWQVSDLP
ncbi:hypothetical protein N7475_009468 [Penicillium sp. IBT 31633x]|nr:hypothetical protein N7475_009468 [Penicillium sp. IBT 31633x]